MSNHGHTDHQFKIMPTEDHSAELGHIVQFRVYVGILLTLLFLTVVTVAISRLDFGSFNIVIAMVVASIKAVLVAMFFMHLKFESKITIGYAVFPLVLLAILMAGIFIDNPYRVDENGPSAIEAFSGGRIDYSNPEAKAGPGSHGESTVAAHH